MLKIQWKKTVNNWTTYVRTSGDDGCGACGHNKPQG